MHGYELEIEDIYALQQMCAYEVCELCFKSPKRVHRLLDCCHRVFQILRAVHRRRVDRIRLLVRLQPTRIFVALTVLQP